MESFNAGVGCDLHIFPGVIYSHSVGSVNENSVLLFSFCKDFALSITNASFQHKLINNLDSSQVEVLVYD